MKQAEIKKLQQDRDQWQRQAVESFNGQVFLASILDEIAGIVGDEAYRDDEGNYHDIPNRVKLPELIRKQYVALRPGMFRRDQQCAV